MNPTIATSEDFLIGAETTKQVYDSYIKAGFTNEQAMAFTEAILVASIKK